MKTLYEKRGRRYVPVTLQIDAASAMRQPGIWLVTSDDCCHSTLYLSRVGDVPDAVPLAALMQHVNVAAKAVRVAQSGEKNNSNYGIAEAVLRAVAQEVSDDASK